MHKGELRQIYRNFLNMLHPDKINQFQKRQPTQQEKEDFIKLQQEFHKFFKQAPPKPQSDSESDPEPSTSTHKPSTSTPDQDWEKQFHKESGRFYMYNHKTGESKWCYNSADEPQSTPEPSTSTPKPSTSTPKPSTYTPEPSTYTSYQDTSHKKQRCCSNCKQPGHTKTTCPELHPRKAAKRERNQKKQQKPSQKNTDPHTYDVLFEDCEQTINVRFPVPDGATDGDVINIPYIDLNGTKHIHQFKINWYQATKPFLYARIPI